MKTVTTTELTHNTKAVLDKIRKTGKPVVITHYDVPLFEIKPMKKKLKTKNNLLEKYRGKYSFPGVDENIAINHDEIYDI